MLQLIPLRGWAALQKRPYSHTNAPLELCEAECHNCLTAGRRPLGLTTAPHLRLFQPLLV